MKVPWKLLSACWMVMAIPPLLASAEPQEATPPVANEPLPEEYSCTFCHADSEKFFDETANLLVTEKDLVNDVHWQRGIRCHDCHGGHPNLFEYVDHRKDDTFRPLQSPAEIPGFCGACHSNIDYMRRYEPSARTDQEAEYWTSGHGQSLKALENPQETKVATCVSCHSRHDILAVDDQNSPVYPTRVAETCATCHADEALTAGLTYHDRPLGHHQYAQWRNSIHAQALLENGDLSAATCNDCHGNHGALPPEVDSVANACGKCHGKVAKLFAETRMKHRFEEVGLPGCATCHGSHETLSPTDLMLGIEDEAVCADCHRENQHGATLAGADVARMMRDGLEKLKTEIAEAEAKIEEAERLGMEVRGPRFDLRQAQDALTNARSLIHSFAPQPVEDALAAGLEVTGQIRRRAEEALQEHTYRRLWLAGSLVPILLVISLLIAYIRTFPAPAE